MNEKAISEKLSMFNQSHMLRFENELSDENKEKLYNQLSCLDYSVLRTASSEEKRGEFSLIDAVTIEEIEKHREEFEKIGIEKIRNGKVGAVLLARGQGSRLGFEHPKGMLNIGVNKELYIFERLIKNLLKVVKKAGAWILLFVMTSEQNNDETQAFFKEHNFFWIQRSKCGILCSGTASYC